MVDMGCCHPRLFVLAIVFFAVYFATCYSTNVAYDNRALLINGERRIIISGSIHYPRSTAAMWPSLIKKAKEGGLNAIETYVFWNAHEPLYRQYNFTGNLDIVKFLKTIQSEGLYAILRIGPYVCAEWNYGGLPVWLHNLNATFRTTDNLFMSEMKTFTDLIVDKMKEERLFAPDGGPIILAQIENEYGNVEWKYGEAGKQYINWCAKYAQSLNIGVPWIMCQQGNDIPDNIIRTCNGFYCDQYNNKNKAPKMWTENWTGWFKNWGQPDPHRPAEDVAFAVGRFYQLRGTVQNYYMYHGGTNFGRYSGGPYIVTSYDYDAPLNEYGLENQPKWGHLKNLHEALYSVEKHLTYGDFQDTNINGDWKFQSTVYNLNGSRVCFFTNVDNKDHVLLFEGNPIPLPPWSISIYRDCRQEIFNSAKINVQSNALGKVKQAGDFKWYWRAEPIQYANPRTDKTHTKYTHPLVDQMRQTSDTSDYLWYLSSVSYDEGSPIWGSSNVKLQIHTTGHVLHVFVNTKHIGSHWAEGGDYSFVFEKYVQLHRGINTISLLSGTVGLPNYGPFYDRIVTGVLGPMKLVATNGQEVDMSTSNKWGYDVGILGLDSEHLYSDDVQRRWHSEYVQTGKPLTWYRTCFDSPPGDDPVVLDLEGMGKGTAWVNGNNIGRYWPSFKSPSWGCDHCNYAEAYDPNKNCRTGCGGPSQKWYHVPRSFLNPNGDNSLVLFEEFGGNPKHVSVHTVGLTKV